MKIGCMGLRSKINMNSVSNDSTIYKFFLLYISHFKLFRLSCHPFFLVTCTVNKVNWKTRNSIPGFILKNDLIIVQKKNERKISVFERNYYCYM